MELLFEFLGEFFLEGIFEIIKNKKVSKWIRYPLCIIVCIFYGGLIFLFAFLGIRMFQKENILVGFLMFTVSIFLGVGLYYLFKKSKKE